MSKIEWLVYGNPNYYAYSSEMRILLSGRQLPCDRPPLHCVREDGNSILEEFGFDNADPYVSMLIMILMTIFYLILSMIALLPKGYIKNYFHAHYGHPFSSKDDRENVEYPLAEVSEEESAEIVHGPLVHTSAVWTTLKRQATRANLLNRLPGPIIVPCADYVPGDTASRPRLSSGGKANLVKRQKSLAVVTSTSTEQQRTLAKGASSYWKSKITLSRTTPPVEFVSSDEPARRAAMHWLAVTRLKKGIRSESLDNGGIASASTKLMAASIMKWSRTVQEKQLKDRREQSKRQIDGGKRLVEESLDLLLNQVRNRSGSDTSNMTASRANAVGNWRRATKRLKRREEEWRAEVKSSTQTDSAPVLDSVDGHRKGRPEGKMKRVQIQEMPLIHEDTDTDDVVHSMDRSPRLGLSSRGSAQDGVLHGDTSQQSLRPQPSPPTPSITEVSNSRDSRLSTSSCDSQGSVKPLTPSRSSSLSSSSIKMPVPVLTEEPRKYSHHRHRLQSRESYHQMVDEPATQSSIGGRSPGKKRGSRVNTHETAC